MNANTPDVLRIMGTQESLPEDERGKTDNVHVVGGAERIIDPSARPAIFELINLAVHAHGITGVELLGPWRFADPRHVNPEVSQKTRHDHFNRCLRRSREIIAARYPGLIVSFKMDEEVFAETDWSVVPDARRIEIHCMDPRLDNQLVEAFNRGYVLRIPGGASSFNRPNFRDFMLSELARIQEKMALEKRVIESIVLCDHWDCAALDGTARTKEMEIAKHQGNLLDAAQVIRCRFDLLGWQIPALGGRIYHFNAPAQIFDVSLRGEKSV